MSDDSPPTNDHINRPAREADAKPQRRNPKLYAYKQQIALFLAEECDLSDPAVSIRTTALYAAYREWALSSHKLVLSPTQFGQVICNARFNRAPFAKVRKKVGGKNENHYMGLALAY